VTAEQVRELFSAAYDAQLDADEQQAFDAALSGDRELAAEYRDFRATLDAVHESAMQQVATPDLLRGVQTRLRNKSAGRFYADRFAERSGATRRSQPLTLIITLLLMLALAGVSFSLLRAVHLLP
jgi:anti-sigma factor RsiW